MKASYYEIKGFPLVFITKARGFLFLAFSKKGGDIADGSYKESSREKSGE